MRAIRFNQQTPFPQKVLIESFAKIKDGRKCDPLISKPFDPLIAGPRCESAAQIVDQRLLNRASVTFGKGHEVEAIKSSQECSRKFGFTPT